MMLCDVPLHPRTRSTKGPDCPNDIQKRLRSPRQHLDDRQHSINPLPKRPAIDQRTEFVRLVRIHELFRLEEVILPILEDRADICWGSRFAGSINYKMPLIRLWGNKFFTWLMNKLTSYEISDAQTGLMAFGRKYLEKFEIHGNYNPPQQLLIDANCKSMRYTEVPVNFDPRVTGESFVSAKYPFCVLMNILRILVYANPLRVYSYIGLSFMSLSVLYFLFTNIGLKMGWDMTIFIIENLSLALLMIGLQAFFFGLLADMIMKKRS